MSVRLSVEGAPLGGPVAWSHARRSPLLDATFSRITPGALPCLRAVLSLRSRGRT